MAAVEAEQNGFGYGMSYTTFGQAITDFDVSGDTVTVKVTAAKNPHRFAFGGRNFEYYSEEVFLSAAEVAASVDNGISSASP